MPFPRISLIRLRRAHAAVSSVDFLYVRVAANGKVRGITAYTPNLKRDEQLVRIKAESP